jgi:hypothetical protein
VELKHTDVQQRKPLILTVLDAHDTSDKKKDAHGTPHRK